MNSSAVFLLKNKEIFELEERSGVFYTKFEFCTKILHEIEHLKNSTISSP